MLQLSVAAAAYVDDARRRFELPDSAGLRFWVDPDGHETQFRVGFVERPDSGDEVVEMRGAKVFIAFELRDAFVRQVLDFDEAAKPPQLVLRNREDVA